MVTLVNKDQSANRVHWVSRVQQVRMAKQDLEEILDNQDLQELKDQLVYQGRQAIQGLKVPLVTQDNKDQLVRPVKQDLKDL